MAKITNTSAIWGWSMKELPAPFEGIEEKKYPVASKYNAAGGTSTLVNGIIKAVNLYADLSNGLGVDAAIGEEGDSIYVERKSESSSMVNVICYNKIDGNCKGGSIDPVSKAIEPYELIDTKSTPGKIKYDGTAIYFAMLPAILEDEEANEKASAYIAYRNEIETAKTAGVSIPSGKQLDAAKEIAVLCDNVYRRVLDGTLPLDLPTNNAVAKVTQISIDSGKFGPKSTIMGVFTHLYTDPSKVSSFASASAITIAPGEYALELSRELTRKNK